MFRRGRYLLDETVTTAAAAVILLQLDKLELTKWLEDVLQILLCNAEVDIANIQPVKGDRGRMLARGLRVADLAVLLSLSKLDNDGNT